MKADGITGVNRGAGRAKTRISARVILSFAVIAAISVAVMAALDATSPGSIMTIQDAHAQFQSGGVDKDGTWYTGEGLKQGDYFSYSMCHTYHKECVKFGLDMWIGGEIQTGTETKWLVETVVYDGNRIIVGNMELGKITSEPTGGSDELKKYRDAFKSSVVWLSAFATAENSIDEKGPKAFRDVSWGKIANIGGEQVRTLAIEEVKAAERTWETVKVGWRTGGYNSNIWVVDDFPFPIKAKTYTHVSEGIPPKEYEFVLLDYKENVQENPFSGITPTSELMSAIGCETGFDKDITIKKSTASSMYQIHVFYGPEDPKSGCSMEWQINFFKKHDETEFLNQVQFDIWTFDENMTRTRSVSSEEGRQFLYSPSGQTTIEIPIDEKPGQTNYVIWVYGLAHENTVPSDPHDYLEIPIMIHKNDAAGLLPTPQPPATAPQIPGWVKNNAGWWAEGVIDDGSFIQGIQYLISQGIIQIPQTDSGGAQDAVEPQGIPSWIKNNAEWWADGIIDDGTFVMAIQYLIKNGIIVVASDTSPMQ